MNNKNTPSFLIQRIGGNLLLIFLITFLFSCQDENALFKEVDGKKLGVDFINSVHQDEIFNILSFELLFNGAGVAIDDFNNDGLQDLFFTGNIVDNQLYLNKGNLKFSDVSEVAKIQASGKWCSGVTTVDINADGWKDIYVCATLSGQENSRKNMLFINQGLNSEGIPVFEEKASAYGIDDSGHSTQAVFFDYDRDNDLDLYVLTDQLEMRSPNKYYFKRTDGSAPNTDRFYRNNGDGTFSNYSKEAGIQIEGYGLGVNVFDVNEDGWLDIYVANDYLTNDVLYINNQDGTFTNRISQFIKHQSHSSMGSDVADINNDGRMDIITLEMLPRDQDQLKRMWPPGQFNKTISNEKLGYDFQYMRNMVQVNQGMTPHGDVLFSDYSFYSGLAATEWSWSALWNDYDADGDNDLFVTNGIAKDMTDLDFVAFKSQTSLAMGKTKILEALPEHKELNFLFRNDGNLSFAEVSKEWGISKPTFSNGAAYGDLDNDGDLDLVSNNINDRPTFLINQSTNHQYLKLTLKDEVGGAKAIGSKVTLYQGNQQHIRHFMPVRGYISSVEPMLYFGLPDTSLIDSIRVDWVDGTTQLVVKPSSDQHLIIPYQGQSSPITGQSHQTLFTDISDRHQFRHLDARYIDFNSEPLLPRQYSLQGPALAAGDLDNDGQCDLVIGGTFKNVTIVGKSDGQEFRYEELEEYDRFLEYEDTGLLLFDADGDEDLDLFAVSGSNEDKANTAVYNDRLYLNDGTGQFERSFASVPPLVTSGSCVRGADFDRDGDIDLFVGGRIYPGAYPQSVSSFILQNTTNEKGQVVFENQTQSLCPELINIGMVTDAQWVDFDNDEWIDLVLVGEWMAPRFFKNNQGVFEPLASPFENSNPSGWWYSLVSGDFDNDGDTDFIAGNQGTNGFYTGTPERPLHIIAKDFDQNGGYDAFLAAAHDEDSDALYPLHPWDDVLKQMEFLRKRVLTYEDYASSTVTDLFQPQELEGALHLEAGWFHTSYIENLGNGQFEIVPLPLATQVAPVQSMITLDVNADQFLDVIMVGNNFGGDLFAGRCDGFNGLVLLGNGQGDFAISNFEESGFLVSGDARSIVAFPGSDDQIEIIASQNRGPLRHFTFNDNRQNILLQHNDAWAVIHFKDDSKRKVELGYGHSGLAQASRNLFTPTEFERIVIYAADGTVSMEYPNSN